MKRVVQNTGCLIWALLLIVVPILATVSILQKWNLTVVIILCFGVLIDLFIIASLIIIVCGVDELPKED